MKKGLLFSVALPVMVMATWVAQLTWKSTVGTRVQLSVQGYDPRDLLAGHYLMYRVDYGDLGVCLDYANTASDQCVCLNQPEPSSPHRADWFGACPDKGNCPLFLRGACENGRFLAGIERFYIPEGYQVELAVVPENASIVVNVTGSGDAQVLDFLIDNVPLSERMH